jgi:DNA-binding response OmpR family regulator
MTGPAAPPTVLIVDDDSSIRTVVTINLEISGFSVLEAPDGGSALDHRA